MSSKVRVGVISIMLGVGLAGCTPAAFVQRARPVQPCEVRVCTNPGTGLARCNCTTHNKLMQQTRRGFWPHVE